MTLGAGTNGMQVTLFILGAVLLLMTLAYPFGYDQSVFSVGGEMVLHSHAIPTIDFLDTKPPLVFYLYAAALALFGHHTYSIRAFDVLFQAVSLFYFYRVLRTQGLGDRLSALAVFVTLVQYVSSGFWMTAQVESFQLLPALAVVDTTLRACRTSSTTRERIRYGVIAGIALATIFLLKFTLVLIAPAIFLFLLMEPRKDQEYLLGQVVKRRLVFFLAMASTFALLVALYAFFLDVNHGWDRFVESLAWVSNYAALSPLLSVQTVGDRYLGLFPQKLMTTFGPTFFVAGIIGVSRARIVDTNESMARASERSQPPPSTLLLLLGIVSIFGLLGVIYERKMFQYHYTRAFWAFAPFVAIGLQRGWHLLATTWQNARDNPVLRISLAATLGAALLYSPVMQVLSQPIRWTANVLLGRDQYEVVQDRTPDYFADDMKQVANALSPMMRSDDQLFFWGNEVALYFELGRLPTTIALTSIPLRTSFTPGSWRASVIHSLSRNPPRFVVVEFGDSKEFITGLTDDSYQAMQKWDELRTFIDSNYHVIRTMNHYILYERSV